MKIQPPTPVLLRRMDATGVPPTDLSAGQIYLCDNRLLNRPLALSNVKHMLLGHCS